MRRGGVGSGIARLWFARCPDNSARDRLNSGAAFPSNLSHSFLLLFPRTRSDHFSPSPTVLRRFFPLLTLISLASAITSIATAIIYPARPSPGWPATATDALVLDATADDAPLGKHAPPTSPARPRPYSSNSGIALDSRIGQAHPDPAFAHIRTAPAEHPQSTRSILANELLPLAPALVVRARP